MTNEKVNPVHTSELNRPIAIGYDPLPQRVYWTDNEAKVVKSTSIFGMPKVILKANRTGNLV